MSDLQSYHSTPESPSYQSPSYQSSSYRSPSESCHDDSNNTELFLDKQIWRRGGTRIYSGFRGGRNFAVKTIDLVTATQGEIDQFENDWEIHRSLDHPNIVKAYDFYYRDKTGFMVLELADCDLHSFVENNKVETSIGSIGLSESVAKRWFYQILSAVSYLHDNNIAHRDLKLENILVKDNSVMLADFGFSQKIDGDNSLSNKCGGTIYFLSPELIRSVKTRSLWCLYKTDIWALGVILYAMLLGKFPYKREALLSPKLHGLIINGVSPEAKNLLQLMLNLNPDHRPDANTLLNHRWFSSA